MSDNPFSEPDDSDKTVIRPAPGGRRGAPPSASPFAAAPASPAPMASAGASAIASAGAATMGPERVAMGGSLLIRAAAPDRKSVV